VIDPLSLRSQKTSLARPDSRIARPDHVKTCGSRKPETFLMKMTNTRACAFFAVLLALSPAAPRQARAEEAKIEIVDLSVDSSSQPRFGQELKLRLTVKNKSNTPARGVAVEVRRTGAVAVRLVLGDMGVAEQRILPLSTGLTLGAAEACFTVVPVLGTGAPAGPARPYCVTPGCYTVAPGH
jgi:hypothetical protein